MTAKPPARPARKAAAAPARPRRRAVTGTPVEQSLAAERAAAALEAEEAALSEVAGKSGPEGIEAIISGASPDDAARMRDYLGLPKPGGKPRKTSDELKRWLTDIESDERQAQVQLKRLEADLMEILPALGYAFDTDDRPDGNVVSLPKPAVPRVEPNRPARTPEPLA